MNKKQKEFLLLRADGLSYDKISQKLNTHKTTLIEWSKLFENEIKDLQFINLQQLKEEYKHTTTERYKRLLKYLNKIDKAIEEIKLEKVSIKDLMLIRNDLILEINKVESTAIHTTPYKEDDSFIFQKDAKVKLDEL